MSTVHSEISQSRDKALRVTVPSTFLQFFHIHSSPQPNQSTHWAPKLFWTFLLATTSSPSLSLHLSKSYPFSSRSGSKCPFPPSKFPDTPTGHHFFCSTHLVLATYYLTLKICVIMFKHNLSLPRLYKVLWERTNTSTSLDLSPLRV